MKKYMLITALCLVKTGYSKAAEKKPIDFTIQQKPCSDSLYCLQALVVNKVVGTIIFKESDHNLHVSFIGVNPEFRSNGIGTALLNAAETSTNCKKVSLIRLDSSVKFYKKLGFTCDSSNNCTKLCSQSSLQQPAQTNKLASQNTKYNGDVQ